MKDNILEYIFYFSGLLIVLLGYISYFKKIIKPTLKEKAKIKEKYISMNSINYIIFDIPSLNKSLVTEVSDDIYNSVKENDGGTIFLKNNKFVDFKK